MPGFMINATGGDTGAAADAKAEFRRKHRWRVQVGGPLSGQNWTYLQKAARPHYKLEEPVAHHNEEQAYFAGKRSWEPINFVWYDSVTPDTSGVLYNWVGGGGTGAVTNIKTANTNTPTQYKTQLKLQMLDGQGKADENWSLYNAWPKEVNWNELDYTNTELQLINVTVRFDRAEKVNAQLF